MNFTANRCRSCEEHGPCIFPMPCKPQCDPILRWAGSKRQLLPELMARIPRSWNRFKGKYYEPFLGSGALFFALAPTRARLNDANGHLVKMYRAVRDEPKKFCCDLDSLAAAHDAEMYAYSRRALNAGQYAPAVVAYLNKTCYNGLWRVNRSGKFNVPCDSSKKPKNIFNADVERAILAASRALKRSIITSQDFALAVQKAGPDDFVYFDPPYLPLSDSSDFTAYAKGGFNFADHERLRDCALELKNRGVKALLSNSYCDKTLELYGRREFNIEIVEARRNINSKASGRGKIREVIIS